MNDYLAGAVAISAVAAWFDWKRRTIPNWLTLPSIAAAIVIRTTHAACHDGLRAAAIEAMMSIAGAATCAGVPLLMYSRGVMGGGDVKVFAALGAILRPLAALEAQTYSLVIASLFACGELIWNGTLFQTLYGSVRAMSHRFRARRAAYHLPKPMVTWLKLGPAIFAGTALTLVIHIFSSGIHP